MLTIDELERFFKRKHLLARAIEEIYAVRGSDPARRVRATPASSSTRYACEKMGMVIQAESLTVELPFLIWHAHHPESYEIWDQTRPIPLRYADKNGRLMSVFHTPDYFLISEFFVGFVDGKTEEACRKKPHLYTQDENGKWRCIAGEIYAQSLGLGYMVTTDRSFSAVRLANMENLGDFIREGAAEVHPDNRDKIIREVRAAPFAWYRDLIPPGGTFRPDDVMRLIALGDLHVDLDSHLLTDTSSLKIFANAAARTAHEYILEASQLKFQLGARLSLAAGSPICFAGKPAEILANDGKEILLKTDTGAVLTLKHDNVVSLIREKQLSALAPTDSQSVQIAEAVSRSSPENFTVAVHRLLTLFPERLPPNMKPLKAAGRTLRQWRSDYRIAEEASGIGFLGLFAYISRRGNRTPRLDPRVVELIRTKYLTEYCADPAPSKALVAANILNECIEEKLDGCSIKTIMQHFKKLSVPHEETLMREGEKAAYATAPFYLPPDWLDRAAPRHGTRVFELAHIDSTQVDAQLVDELFGTVLGKPYLTLLIDAYTRMILAWYLSFDPPSYVSSMMVLRICALRHGRLPSTIICDGGPEFRATEFELALAMYSVNKRTRPVAKGHAGCIVERSFGGTNTQFFHNLRGNNRALQHPRSMSPTHDPRQRAIWNLRALDLALADYFENTYHATEHPVLGVTPRAAAEISFAETGLREARFVARIEDIEVALLPQGRKRVIVRDNGTIRMKYGEYSAPEFQAPGVAREVVSCRYNPVDITYAYAFIKSLGRWVKCFSKYHAELKGMSAREIEVRSQHLRQRGLLAGRRYVDRIMLVGKNLNIVRSKEEQLELDVQRARDAAKTPPQAAEAPSVPEASSWPEIDWNDVQKPMGDLT